MTVAYLRERADFFDAQNKSEVAKVLRYEADTIMSGKAIPTG